MPTRLIVAVVGFAVVAPWSSSCKEGGSEGITCGALEECDGMCVDTDLDAHHCGQCWRPCAPGRQCVEGLCEQRCQTDVITDATELQSLLEGLPWTTVGPYTTGHLPITCDVRVEGAVSLDASDLAVPASCSGDCRQSIGFEDSSGQEGVVLENVVDDGLPLDDPDRVTLTDVTVRFRAKLVDTHPFPYNYVPRISVMPPEQENCGSVLYHCGLDKVCYGVEGYCKYCLSLDLEQCACFREDGFLPDGTVCHYALSGDSWAQGECRDGRCEHIR